MTLLLSLLISMLCVASSVWGQVPSPVPSTPIVMVPAYYATIPISATAAAAAQTTLTIPAPAAGLYNYVCYLGYQYSQTNSTGTVQTNAVTTSTNFNGFALKYSVAAAINTNYDWKAEFGDPATGCAKSTSPATATTFVSPSAATNGAFTWYAEYFQAP